LQPPCALLTVFGPPPSTRADINAENSRTTVSRGTPYDACASLFGVLRGLSKMRQVATRLQEPMRSAILAVTTSLMAACASPNGSGVTCTVHESTLPAIEARVLDTNVFPVYEVRDCISGIHEKNVHDEACALDVRAGDKPQPPLGWERKPITFVPTVVRELAEKHKIHIATLYSTGNADEFYGDDDLSRAIVYKRVIGCDKV
jgi:hypothetical protein